MLLIARQAAGELCACEAAGLIEGEALKYTGILILVMAANAAEERHGSFQELIVQALRNNPEVIAAQKNYEAARQRPTQLSSLPSKSANFLSVPDQINYADGEPPSTLNIIYLSKRPISNGPQQMNSFIVGSGSLRIEGRERETPLTDASKSNGQLSDRVRIRPGPGSK